MKNLLNITDTQVLRVKYFDGEVQAEVAVGYSDGTGEIIYATKEQIDRLEDTTFNLTNEINYKFLEQTDDVNELVKDPRAVDFIPTA